MKVIFCCSRKIKRLLVQIWILWVFLNLGYKTRIYTLHLFSGCVIEPLKSFNVCLSSIFVYVKNLVLFSRSQTSSCGANTQQPQSHQFFKNCLFKCLDSSFVPVHHKVSNSLMVILQLQRCLLFNSMLLIVIIIKCFQNYI